MSHYSIEDLVRRGIEEGKRTQPKRPYFEILGYLSDPFEKELFFRAESIDKKIREISNIIGKSTNKEGMNVAIVGPKGVGKTTLLQEIHKTARKYSIGRWVYGNKLPETAREQTIDGHVFRDSYLDLFLEEVEDFDYLMIDQTDDVPDKIIYFINQLRSTREVIQLKPTIFVSMDLVAWEIVSLKKSAMFDEVIFIKPLGLEDSKALLLRYLEGSSRSRVPFSKEAIELISRMSYGYISLMLLLAKESLLECSKEGYEICSPEIIEKVAYRKAFKAMPPLIEAKETFEESTRKKILDIMLSTGRPLSPSEIAFMSNTGRTSVHYHLKWKNIGKKKMKKRICQPWEKKPRRRASQLYEIRLAPRIAFEHRYLEEDYHE